MKVHCYASPVVSEGARCWTAVSVTLGPVKVDDLGNGLGEVDMFVEPCQFTQ